MALELQIDRASEVPVYRQIIEKIASLIRAGSLKPGDRLPPERELSAQLGIARGTITRAYEELARNGIVEVASGRGSFVSARQDVIPSGRKERAVQLINGLMKELVELRFSYREIKSMVDLVVLEREEQLESLSIAVVDCSPEALKYPLSPTGNPLADQQQDDPAGRPGRQAPSRRNASRVSTSS